MAEEEVVEAELDELWSIVEGLGRGAASQRVMSGGRSL